MKWYEEVITKHKLPEALIGEFAGIDGIAVFDNNELPKHRYFLEKRWNAGGKVLAAMMMNPSAATQVLSDKTVDQLMEVAIANGCNALHVINVSSFICGQSKLISQTHFGFDKINWDFITMVILNSDLVFLGWGVKGQLGMLEQLVGLRKTVLINALCKLRCYDVLESKNKKIKAALKPLYYVPHPRPIPSTNKYANTAIRPIKVLELRRLLK